MTKIAIDVHYKNDRAAVAAVVFDGWTDHKPTLEITLPIPHVLPYEPGQFYKRELPCILTVLHELALVSDTIVIDGFVTLGQHNRAGLGAHLYRALERRTPVIGVAKSAFKDTPVETQLCRGRSTRPLYITSAGVPLDCAKAQVAMMHGLHRIPVLLKKVDELCRAAIEQSA